MVATGNGKVGKWKINILDQKDNASGKGQQNIPRNGR